MEIDMEEIRSTRDVAIGADKRAKRTDLASITALIVAITGFVAVFVHKPTEDAAREGYVELGKSIAQSQEAERKNHEDLAAMRAYLEGLRHAQLPMIGPPSPSSAPSTAAAPGGSAAAPR